MKIKLFVAMMICAIAAAFPIAASAEGLVSSVEEKVYTLTDREKSRWGINDNRSNPVETTAGWNKALKWAAEQGYTTFRVEDGHYLIAKGTREHDPVARINMVGNMKLSLDKDVILEKETNRWETYSLLYVGNIENVIIEGGQFLGDRETHNYDVTGEGLLGTHEWGNGINLKGSENVIINNVKMKNFAGDSIEVGGYTVGGYYIKGSMLEKGSYNDQGQPIAQNGKVRTNNRSVTDLKQSKYQGTELFMWLPQGVRTNYFDIYYYNADGTFISSQKKLKFFTGLLEIPEEAAYYHLVMDADDPSKVNINAMHLERSTNVTIQNSDLGYSRRQGISVVGGENVTVRNNHIHHVKGTAPQSGIDLEGGYFLNHDVTIAENYFSDNAGYDVILFDGNTAVVENNVMASKAIGLAISKPFDYATIRNNEFNHATITVVGNNADFYQNIIENSRVGFSGEAITFKDNELYNTPVSLDNKKPFTVKMENLFIENSPIYIGSNPVNLSQVTLKGEKSAITGPGNDQNIYKNLKVENYTNLSLPKGQYQTCSFTSGNGSAVGISQEGNYSIQDCSFTSDSNVLSIKGSPSVAISNSRFNVNKNIGYGASFYVLGAKKLSINDSVISAKNNTVTHTPIMKFGPYGSPAPTKIFDVSMKNVQIQGNPANASAVTGLDTKNAGTDAPAYRLENVKVENALVKLHSKHQIQ
ncbi:right-handed parallel beta-helix repeat-containing protein [Jeotgalibacillus aurantiacus]|uniref:right-handed parallel beta-helix repeat-containing protein n=1 Tax=Jeotgalibacillus aurantiacus TaxID=2763266 RepID=UPI001D09B6F8|nr:right-handed parallel beta-helix repeat-containing protein [Jeotgalibacillus aurantiacus]